MYFLLYIFILINLCLVGAMPSALAQKTMPDATYIDSLEQEVNSINHTPSKVSALQELATYYLERNIGKSLAFGKQALQIATQQEYTFGRIQAHIFMGNFYAQRGNYAEAIQHLIKGMKIAEKHNYLEQRQKILNAIGNIYRSQKNYTKAIENFKEALQIAEQLKDKTAFADAENNIGTCYYLLKENDMALQYYQNTLKIRLSIQDELGVAKVMNNIALIYKRQKRYAEALKNFEHTFEIQQKIGSKAGIAIVLDNIGDTYLLLNQPQKALEFHLKGLQLALELDNKEILLDAYQSLAASYATLKNYEKAYHFEHQYNELQEMLVSTEIQKKLSDEQIMQSLERKAKELELSQQKSELQALQLRQSQYLTFFIGAILILSLTLGVTLYARYKANKALNEQLQITNTELQQRTEEVQIQAEEIQTQNQIIVENHLKLTDSIMYAKYIQDAMLIQERGLHKIYPSIFVLYLPKDIVSGDFYWVDALCHEQQLQELIVIVADCTGHGVPGALMTVIGQAFLDNIIKENKVRQPALILQELDKRVGKILNQEMNKNELDTDVGMDMGVLRWNLAQNEVLFAAAKRPLYHIRNETLEVVKGDKFSIGGKWLNPQGKIFQEHTLQVQEADLLYLFTDGYADQFGDNPNVKYTLKRLKEQLYSICGQPIHVQRRQLAENLQIWQGEQKQTDDILVVGLQIYTPN